MKNYTLFLFWVAFLNGFSQEKLNEVKVETRSKGIQKSLNKVSNVTVVSSKELLKAACCNLAESFETNPSIDVNFSDALTGTKQIKMLGLTSPYILIAEENIPSVRGASQAYGLSFTPGTWVESIQITKGAGSVVNGFESISGQINTELIKPKNDLPFYVNFYGATEGRFELNTHFNHQFSDKWASSFYVHGNTRTLKNDMNKDGFLDNPLGKQLNVVSRWQYTDNEKGWVSFFNFKFMDDQKQTGELAFVPDTDRLTTQHWGSEINTKRFDFTSKIGYVFKDMPFQSIGIQNAFSAHNQDSYFGLRTYSIFQKSYYSNIIFNSIINNTHHKFSTGLNFTLDHYSEYLTSIDFSRIDNSLGAFFEYTYDSMDTFSFIVGSRIDYHNRLGVFYTPRIHVRYNPWEKSVLRFSAGRGKRAANLFAENQHLLGSSRAFSILDSEGKIYGLQPEIAWNYGVSFTQNFQLFHKKADIGFDFYRTVFQNQAVIDIMQSPQQVLFYNLRGASYANSFQLDFGIELLKHLNLRTSYKYFDIATDYLSGSFQRPLQAKHRFFMNVEYATHITDKGSQWKFDFTLNWLGKQQLPNTFSNPETDRLPSKSPSFSVMNTQITKTFSSVFELYVGGENIGNYRQEKAVLGASNPFGATFDTSMIYAPIFGQMYYVGLRYKIKNKK